MLTLDGPQSSNFNFFHQMAYVVHSIHDIYHVHSVHDVYHVHVYFVIMYTEFMSFIMWVILF